MSHGKASALTGYIVAAIVLIPFFWFTLGDAYGRFMVSFNPDGSTASYYLAPYTGHLTALICLSAPLLLAWFLKSVVANWVDSVWEMTAKTSCWLLVKGKKLSAAIWQQVSRRVRKLKDSRSDKPDDQS